MKWKNKKVMYLTEVDEKVLDKDILSAGKLMDDFKADYKKFMKNVLGKKTNTQTRMMCIEMIVMSLLHDGNLPNYFALGMLEKIKSQLINQNFTPPETPKKREVGYVG